MFPLFAYRNASPQSIVESRRRCKPMTGSVVSRSSNRSPGRQHGSHPRRPAIRRPSPIYPMYQARYGSSTMTTKFSARRGGTSVTLPAGRDCALREESSLRAVGPSTGRKRQRSVGGRVCPILATARMGDGSQAAPDSIGWVACLSSMPPSAGVFSPGMAALGLALPPDRCGFVLGTAGYARCSRSKSCCLRSMPQR